MALMLAKEQPKAIKTEGPGWLASTGQCELSEVGSRSRRRRTCVCRRQENWTRKNKMKDSGRSRLTGLDFEGLDWSSGKGMPMSTFMSWLFHRGRTEEGSAEVTRTSRPLSEEETGQERRMASSTAEDGPDTGLNQPSGGHLFVDFDALAHRQNALFEGLTPVHEKAALFSFVGTGITDPKRYENAAAAFNQLRLMAPVHEGALIQVFTHKLHEESKGSDFLYLHFAGHPLSFGFLICALTGGGLMAGWKLI
jgi:hypothetical protein